MHGQNRWQRALGVSDAFPRVHAIRHPSHRSVCPRTVSHSPATTLSRTMAVWAAGGAGSGRDGGLPA
eukprot:3158511-Prymnesium_polylepis.2